LTVLLTTVGEASLAILGQALSDLTTVDWSEIIGIGFGIGFGIDFNIGLGQSRYG
jgi:hypothetical protein